MYKLEKLRNIILTSINDIFLKKKAQLEINSNVLISIVHIDLNKNFSNVKIYLSIITKENVEELLKKIESKKKKIRLFLGESIKNKISRIPKIYFTLDPYIEKAFTIDKLLSNINDKEKTLTT